MRKIKLFKNVAFAAATVISAATITTTCIACTFTKKEEPYLSYIKIQLPQSSIELDKGSIQKISKAIKVECFDQNWQHYDAQTIIEIESIEPNITQDWIWIDKENKININGSVDAGTYKFRLFAREKDGNIKSDKKTFSVKIDDIVPPEPEVVDPDHIELVAGTTQKRVFPTQTGNILIKSFATKEGYDPKYVKQECNFEILSFDGPQSKDQYGNELFRLSSKTKQTSLIISSDITNSWIGDYTVNIRATSQTVVTVYADITITINVRDGYHYIDEKNGVEYLRGNYSFDWEIYRTADTVYAITPDMILEEIYGSKVTGIKNQFGLFSGSLSSVILPDFITKIGDSAFRNMTSLYSLAMPGVKTVGVEAFSGCSNMSLLLNYDQPVLEVVNPGAFNGCVNFDLEVTNKIKTLGDRSFAGSGITNIKLGGNVNIIGIDSFANCPNLKTIQIDQVNPPKIAGPILTGCSSIEAIKVPSNGIENYKNATNWQIYADLIVGI